MSTSPRNELEQIATTSSEFQKDDPVRQQHKTNKFIDESIPTVNFYCQSCGMDEKCHLKSMKPPFVSGNLILREEAYVMRDPFAPPPPFGKSKSEYFLILGSDCTKCGKTICKDLTCSFFYNSTYCISCAQETLTSFPKEVQTKLKKQISNISHLN